MAERTSAGKPDKMKEKIGDRPHSASGLKELALLIQTLHQGQLITCRIVKQVAGQLG